MPKHKSTDSSNDIIKYAGLTTQILVSLGVAVYAGYKADKWLHISIPLLVWLLPLIVIILIFYKLIKDTSKRKDP